MQQTDEPGQFRQVGWHAGAEPTDAQTDALRFFRPEPFSLRDHGAETMIRRSICLAAALACIALLQTHSALAQGGTGSAATNATNRAAGSASTLSNSQGYGLDSRFMGSGFDAYTQGSSGLGSTTAGARAGSSGFGQTSSSSTFGGATNNSRGNFGGIGGIGGIGGLGGLGGIGGFGGIGGGYGFGRNSFGGQNSQQASQGNKVIRTRARLGFRQPLPPSSAVSATYNHVISRVLQRGDYGAGKVNVKMEGQVAVLTGAVDSPHARDIAERLALLEPGISEVRNELTVRAAAPTRGTSPTPTAADRRQ